MKRHFGIPRQRSEDEIVAGDAVVAVLSMAIIVAFILIALQVAGISLH